MRASPALRVWLRAQGSLTARLRRHGEVQVQVLRQGPMALWNAERQDLGSQAGYVREVVLHLDGRPAVWARSATSLQSIKGPWKAMQGLGTRPLAELLFEPIYMHRTPLQTHALRRGGLMQRHVHKAWCSLEHADAQHLSPQWARSSVFLRHGHGLRVMEAFSPWVCALKNTSE